MEIISISRGSLTSADNLAQKLSRELSVPVYRREDILVEADKYSIYDTGFCDISFIERSPSIWEIQSSKKIHYILSFQTALLDMAKNGSFIYEGHVGHYLLTGIPFVLKVRVIKPMEKRIANWMKRDNLSYEQAHHYVLKMDERRKKWSEFLYGVDIENPSLYDVLINFDSVSIDTAANIITSALQSPEFHSNGDTLRTMNDIHIASKAKLFLYLSPLTRGLDIELTGDSDNGTITITKISNTDDYDKALMHIKSVLSLIPEINNLTFN